MGTDNLTELNALYAQCLSLGLVRNKKSFAEYVGVNYSNLTGAFNGSKAYLTDSLLKKVRNAVGNADKKFVSNADRSDSVHMIPLIPTVAVGGSLNGHDEGYTLADCEQIPAPIANVDIAMNVYGESMSPEYPNGSRVYARKVDPHTYIEWGQVYILATSSGSIIKEVWKSGKEGCVECHSVNPDAKYAPFDVELESIYGMYRVVGLLTTK